MIIFQNYLTIGLSGADIFKEWVSDEFFLSCFKWNHRFLAITKMSIIPRHLYLSCHFNKNIYFILFLKKLKGIKEIKNFS